MRPPSAAGEEITVPAPDELSAVRSQLGAFPDGIAVGFVSASDPKRTLLARRVLLGWRQ
jgi:hypothetical protein